VTNDALRELDGVEPGFLVRELLIESMSLDTPLLLSTSLGTHLLETLGA
jgi:hypothetical protein